MQYIIKQSQTTHFYQGINAIAQDGSLSDRAARILQYAISLPEDWRVIPRQLMKHFNWGRDVTYKALKELRKRGYAVLVRCRRAATWYIFNTPQTPETLATFTASNQPEPTPDAAPKNPDFKNSTNSDALQNTDEEEKTKKPTTQPPDRELSVSANEQGKTAVDVVVSRDSDEDHHVRVSDVPGIEVKYQQTARKALSALSKTEADAVVTALTLALSKGTVSNPIGYLLQLVKASKNGTFSPVQAAGAAPAPTLAERIAKERAKEREAATRGKMSNAEWFEMMKAKFGDRIKAPNLEGGLRKQVNKYV